MKSTPKRKLLRALSVVLGILAVLTLVPLGRSETVSLLGYKALCSFIPVSTILLLYPAATIHRYLKNTAVSPGG
ncbi:MAG: hypothetical protein ACLFPD_04760 [Desulfosudaceae bacterium]